MADLSKCKPPRGRGTGRKTRNPNIYGPPLRPDKRPRDTIERYITAPVARRVREMIETGSGSGLSPKQSRHWALTTGLNRGEFVDVPVPGFRHVVNVVINNEYDREQGYVICDRCQIREGCKRGPWMPECAFEEAG